MTYDLPIFEGLKVSTFYLLEPMTDKEYIPGKSYYPNGIVLRDAIQRDNSILWKIENPGAHLVINKKGEWEWESLPSGRTDAFLKRCRFATIPDALKAWAKFKKANL